MSRSLPVLMTLLLCGCSKFSTPKEIRDSSFFTIGDSALVPATDKLSPDCFTNDIFDACLFLKNPVAQEKGPVPFSRLNEKRNFGVKIRGLQPTGFLENNRVRVYALHGPRFSLPDRARLKSEMDMQMSHVEQFSAFYWSNRVFDYLGPRLGESRLPIEGLKIYPDDVFTGYSSLNKSIHLEKKSGQLPKSMSGEIVVYLVGQAIADGLTGGKVFFRDSAKHNFCALDPKGCCSSEDGCAQALASAFGDYLAAIMFPESARLGESLADSLDGQKICGLARDLNSLVLQSRSQIYNACPAAGRAVLLGGWYASVWWRLRTQIESQEAGASRDVDLLFFDHARVWQAQSTFAEAKAEALRLAAQHKDGRFLQSFNSAFAAAGL